MNLPALTIGTDAFQQPESTGVSTASPAVIAARAAQKLIPAIFAQAVVAFANALLAIRADCRPEKLV